MGFKIEKYNITAYHCKHCGAPTKPGKELCDWCGMNIIPPKYRKNSDRQIRILIDAGEDYIYFDRITTLEAYETPNVIDCTTLDDSHSRFIYREPDYRFKVGMLLDDRGRELIKKIDTGKIYNTRVEVLGLDQAFELKTYQTIEIRQGFREVCTSDITFVSTENKGWNKLITPDAMTCPNCGAPVNSHYGACDFCGGWLEYEF